MSKSKEQQATTLANYLPGGKTFAAKSVDGTVMRKLLRGFAGELERTDDIIELFKSDILPDLTEHFIEEWESAVGIPDDCFSGSDAQTDIIRRLHITCKLAGMGVQTSADFVELAAKLGVNITIIAASINGAFPLQFPWVFYLSGKEATHTAIITFTLDPGDTFTYTFPIPFGSSIPILVKCVFDKLKPATVNFVYSNL